MAQQVIQLDREKLRCSICLDLLKDPVTIPCGHSYCMSCIKDYWDEESQRKKHSCPQCRQSFRPRPVLVKNTILAELVEELKKVGLQAASPGHSYAGPGDVTCDFCTGRKIKAFKSCLVCMASYCEQHLQPHYDVALLKEHKLVEATLKLQENICSRHEVMKFSCRPDQKAVCYRCSMDDHKGHDTVSAAAERAERQKELEVSRQNIQQRVQDREKYVRVLQLRVEAISLSADEAVRDSEKILTEMIRLIEQRSSEVKQEIRSQQKTEVSRAEELEKKLQQEITELRRKDNDLEQLEHTDDHLVFLNNYPSLSCLSESKYLPIIDRHPLRSFEGVTAAVSDARDKLHAVLTVLSEEWAKISQMETVVDVLPAEPRNRADFLKYSRQITLDPNTAHKRLSLSDRDKKATLETVRQLYLNHPDRFDKRFQVLSREALTGRCYWEVKITGRVSIAAAYKNISRTGSIDGCRFGNNDKSWTLDCFSGGYAFIHNNISTSISGPQSSRIGVYLDHRAGTLSYYSVTDKMTLLHKVETTFTQPLYAGFWLPDSVGDSVELCELNQA